VKNPYPRSVLGAAFHVPAVVKQKRALGYRDVLFRVALAGYYGGTSEAVKAAILRLQDRILPVDRQVFAMFLDSSNAHRMLWLTLDEMDWCLFPLAPAVRPKEIEPMKNPGGNTRQYAAWDRGYAAFGKGLTLKDNPHKASDKVSKEWWQKGWEAAQQDEQP